MNNLKLTLAMMESMCCGSFKTKTHRKLEPNIIPEHLRVGNRNKKCNKCGHKNKKCICVRLQKGD